MWIRAEELFVALAELVNDEERLAASAVGSDTADAREPIDLRETIEELLEEHAAAGVDERTLGRAEGLREAMELVAELMREERRARGTRPSRRPSSRPPTPARDLRRTMNESPTEPPGLAISTVKRRPD